MTATVPTARAADLHAEVVTDPARLVSLADGWHRLWQATPAREIFHHFAWASTWWEAYQDDYSLYLIVVHAGEEVVGLLPLVKQGRSLHFLGHTASDYNTVLAAPEDGAAVLACALRLLFSRGAEWEACLFGNVSERSLFARAVEALPRDLRARLLAVQHDQCPALVLRGHGAEKVAPLVTSSRARYQDRSIARLGPVAFARITDRAEIARQLPGLFDQHIARRALLGDRSQFLDPRTVRFYQQLVTACAPNEELHFSLLMVAGAPAAYHFGFACEGKFTLYKPTFDIDLWKYDPGEVLLHHLLRHAVNTGVEVFDFSVGNEAYKDRFRDEVVCSYQYYCFPPTTAGRLRHLVRAAWERAKLNPRLGPAAKAVVEGLSRARRCLGAMREEGPMRVGSKVLGRARRAIYDRRELALYLAPQAGPSPADRDFRPVALSDLARASLDHPEFLTPWKLRRCRQRLSNGEKGYAAFAGEKLAHVAWLRPGEEITATWELRRPYHQALPAQSLIFEDAWTAPEYRGQGHYARMLRFARAEAARRGLPLWIYVDAANATSRRGIESAGFACEVTVRETTWLGFLHRRRTVYHGTALAPPEEGRP